LPSVKLANSEFVKLFTNEVGGLNTGLAKKMFKEVSINNKRHRSCASQDVNEPTEKLSLVKILAQRS